MNTPELDFSAALSERTPRIVQAAKLLKSSERRKTKRFLVEGGNSVEASLATGAATDVFVTQAGSEKYADLLQLAVNVHAYIHPINHKAAQKLADTSTTPGIFAVCRNVTWNLHQALKGHPRMVCVGVETNDPGNAGTLMRLGDAMGANAVIFAGDTVDPQAPKAARASTGSLFHVPVVRNRDIDFVLEKLQRQGFALAATAADGDLDIRNSADTLEQPIAWLFGNEAHGLSQAVQDRADFRVRIPIRGNAESLNLATAAAICMYETAKVQDAAYERERAAKEAGEELPAAAPQPPETLAASGALETSAVPEA
ncbi:MAG: RNA methyltransferase [Corynebacterium sp.]|nr:RNA methyltransferase [Corynebacterium sp.]